VDCILEKLNIFSPVSKNVILFYYHKNFVSSKFGIQYFSAIFSIEFLSSEIRRDLYNLIQWFSKYGPRPAISSPGNFLECRFFGLTLNILNH
jgi:hypothetical protein